MTVNMIQIPVDLMEAMRFLIETGIYYEGNGRLKGLRREVMLQHPEHFDYHRNNDRDELCRIGAAYEEFTYGQATSMLSTKDANKIINRWIHRGWIQMLTTNQYRLTDSFKIEIDKIRYMGDEGWKIQAL